MTLADFLLVAKIGNWFSITGAVVGSLFFWKRSAEIRLVWMYCLLSVLTFIVGGKLFEYKINPNYAITTFALVNFPLTCLLYYFAFQKRYGWILLAAAVVVTTFGICNLLFFQRSEINSATNIVQSAFVLTFAIGYFFFLMRELPTLYLHLFPMFWVNSALLVYHAGTLALFIFTSYLVNVLNNNLIAYWTFHNLVAMLEISLLLVAMILELFSILRKSNVRFAQSRQETVEDLI